MAGIKLPSPQQQGDLKSTVDNLYDTVLRLRKELEFALLNLDADNIPMMTSVLSSIKANTDQFLTLGELALLDSITSTEITDEAITTPKLAAGSVVASKISVGTLSAISANLGTITAGILDAIQMTGGSITGALFQTASTGQRVQITDNTGIRMYKDASNYSSLTTSVPSVGLQVYSNTNMRLWTPGEVDVIADSVDFTSCNSINLTGVTVTGLTVQAVFG